MCVQHFARHGLLGTVVEVLVGPFTDPAEDPNDDDPVGDPADEDPVAERAAEVAFATIAELESVFSAYDEASDLQRWKRGQLTDLRSSFCQAMADALAWQERSEGAFNPLIGVLTERWRRAGELGAVPSTDELSHLADTIRRPRFTIDDDGRPRPIGDVALLNLNAFVKGWIVDRAAEAALAASPRRGVVVNAGGDLRHAGPGSVLAGVENPLRPFDNEPPVAVVSIAREGLATSGRARRGIHVAGRWFGHVIDARTGWPADAVASVSVIAPEAATADVVATIAGVEPAALAPVRAAGFGTACLVIAATGDHHVNEAWAGRVGGASEA